MKNAKRIFVLLFAALLILMSVMCVSFYDNVKASTVIDENMVLWQLEDELRYFLIGKAMEIDPEYQLLTFSDEVPLEVQESINDNMTMKINDVFYLLDNDEDFIYTFHNTLTQESVSRHTERVEDMDEQPEDFYMYAQLNYDERGNLEANNQIYYESFRRFQASDLLASNIYVTYTFEDYYGYGTGEFMDGDLDWEDWEYIDSGLIEVNMPKNLEAVIAIPKDMRGIGFVANRINSWDLYNAYPAIGLLAGTLILALFFLFYPIRIAEEVNPFLLVKKWKGELNVVWLTCFISAMVVGCMVICGHTINNFLVNLLQNYQIHNANGILAVLNFFVWFFSFYLISIALFLIKYMFAHGFVRYLKEDTLVGTLIYWVKHLFDKSADIDLSLPLTRQVFQIVALNTIVILLINSFFGMSFVLTIIYTVCLFFWISSKMSKIKNDNDKMLEMTRQLAQGNFDNEIDEDVGVFNPLKEELQNIKTGFEKAVQEETKSQNMKTELISHVSHDLKTPLTCIKNYIVLLEDDTLTNEQRQEYLNNVKQYANRLNTLIEDLFEVSKVNSGNIQLEMIDLNIVALIEQSKAEYAELLAESDLTIITSYENPEITVHLDGNKTYRIFENLFTNIGKYAMKHSRVYIDVKEDEENVYIEFKNISAVQMNFTSDEIVERFVRGDKSRHESGSGLGLAIVQSFTEVQGGTLKIDIDGDLFKTILTFKKAVKEALPSNEIQPE